MNSNRPPDQQAITTVTPQRVFDTGGVGVGDGLPYADAPDGGDGNNRPFSFRGILRFKWTIILVTLATLVASQAAIWLLLVAEYRATAVIEVQPIIPKLLDSTEETGPVPFYAQYLMTQADLALSDSVLQRVLDRKEVLGTRWYRNERASVLDRLETFEPPLDRLRKEIEIEVPPGKQILQISLNCPFPGEARTIVDAVAEEYVRYAKDSRKNTDDERIRTLDEGYKDTTIRQIQNLQDEIRVKFLNDEDLKSPDVGDLLASKRLALDDLKTNEQAVVLELEIAKQQGAQEAAAAPNAPAPQQAAGNYGFDPVWVGLEDRIRNTEYQIERGLEKYGRNHATIRDLQGELDGLLVKQAERERELYKAFGPNGPPKPVAAPTDPMALAGGAPQSLQEHVAALEMRLEALRRTIRQKSEEFDRSWKKYQEYKAKQDELELLNVRLRETNQRIFELEQVRQAPGHIKRIGSAYEPSTPNRDRRPKLAMAAIVGALFAGLGAAALRFRISPKVYDMVDVMPMRSAIPLLGYMPLLEGQGVDAAALRQPSQIESIRTIRTTLLARLRSAGGQVLQVTSASSGAGKTTTAHLLAESLARCGKHVLLVDADFRRASLTQRYALNRNRERFEQTLGQEGANSRPAGSKRRPRVQDTVRTIAKSKIDGLENRDVFWSFVQMSHDDSTAGQINRTLGHLRGDMPGLADLLADRSLKTADVSVNLIPGLDMVAAGNVDASTTIETLANGVFSGRIAEWKQDYDIVLLDSGPVLTVSDGAMLAQQVDASIMVVREGHCHRGVVMDACNQLESVGGHIIGSIFLAAPDRRTDGYDYGYGHAAHNTH